ncbi:hypothetical protein [Kibdelosporangium persicum]|uniref:hypothetical protein n=1 Tax=Kibdelosporangium persicum TaxID=2698649 RepID=UPI00156597C0|nr:hypothetical protein [Kibdelosporangium persicum]
MRAGLYRALRQAFDKAGIPWAECDHEDRGDGVIVLAPAQVLKAPFVDSVPLALATALHHHNTSHPAEEQIRLRMALHAGEVAYDEHGVTGTSINLALRLLNAPAVRTALAESPGELAMITSGWFFDEVVRHSTDTDPATFRPVRVAIKETSTVGWISLPDHPYPAQSLPELRSRRSFTGRPPADPAQLLHAADLQKLLGLLDECERAPNLSAFQEAVVDSLGRYFGYRHATFFIGRTLPEVFTDRAPVVNGRAGRMVTHYIESAHQHDPFAQPAFLPLYQHSGVVSLDMLAPLSQQHPSSQRYLEKFLFRNGIHAKIALALATDRATAGIGLLAEEPGTFDLRALALARVADRHLTNLFRFHAHEVAGTSRTA